MTIRTAKKITVQDGKTLHLDQSDVEVTCIIRGTQGYAKSGGMYVECAAADAQRTGTVIGVRLPGYADVAQAMADGHDEAEAAIRGTEFFRVSGAGSKFMRGAEKVRLYVTPICRVPASMVA